MFHMLDKRKVFEMLPLRNCTVKEVYHTPIKVLIGRCCLKYPLAGLLLKMGVLIEVLVNL